MSVISDDIKVNPNAYKAYYKDKPALIQYARVLGINTYRWYKLRISDIRDRITNDPRNAEHIGLARTYMDLLTTLQNTNADAYNKRVIEYRDPASIQDALDQTSGFLDGRIRILEPKVYGNYIHRADVVYRLFPNNPTHVITGLVIRSSNKDAPTPEELAAAVYHAGDAEMYPTYRRSKDQITAQVAGDIKTIPIARSMSWAQRPHYGSALYYVDVLGEAAPHVNALDRIEDTKTCAYDAVARDLLMSHDQIAATVGKEVSAGLTPVDMRKLYSDAGVSLYLFELTREPLENNKFNTVTSNDARPHHSSHTGRERVFVYILANQHVYTPCDEMRKALMKRTAEKVYVPEDEPRPEKKEKPNIIIRATDFADAMEKARVEKERIGAHPFVINAEYAATVSEITAHIEAIKNDPYNKKHRKIKELTSPLKEMIENAKADRDMRIARYGAADKDPVHIYVPTESIGRPYIAHIHNTGHVYPSNLDRMGAATYVRYAPHIAIYANADESSLRRTAQELGIAYMNQSITMLARKAFAMFTEGKGWETSTLNGAIRGLLAQYPVSALNVTFGQSMDTDRCVYGVDFYRNYATNARLGGFYTIDLMAELEPYDGHAPDGVTPYLYYVETGDSILFAGNGAYDYKIVAAGLRYGVIKPDNIIGQVKGCASPAIDQLMCQFVDHIYATVSEDRHRKEIVNMVIGMLGSPNERKLTESVITDNSDEAGYYWHKMGCMPNDKVITPFEQIEAGTRVRKFWLTTGQKPTVRRNTDMLVRIAIVQRARLAVFELMEEIKRKPTGRIIQVKTDAITYSVGRAIKPVPTPEKPTFGDIRPEAVIMRDAWAAEPAHMAIDKYELKANEWMEPETVSDTEYFDAARLKKYRRAFVEGFAGAGKSHVLRELSRLYEDEGKRVSRCAFTHAAANLIDGQTCHNLMGIKRNGDPSEKLIERVMTDVDVILIDEMSMTPQVIYAIMSQLPEHITIVGFGDFRQHQPIEQGQTIHLYRDTTMFKSLFGYNIIRLRKQCRTNARAANEAVAFHDMAEKTTVYGAALLCMPEGINKVEGQRVPASRAARIGEELPDRNLCATNACRRDVNSIVSANKDIPVSPMDRRVQVPMPRELGKRYCVEHFDARKLARIIDTGAKGTAHEYQCMRYLCNARDLDGKFASRQIEYYQSGGHGRWFPSDGMGLTSLPRAIRHAIAGEYYTDIDCSACGPTILEFLTRRLGMQAMHLREYIGFRDGTIRDVMRSMPECTREQVKDLIAAMMMGGCAGYKEMRGFRSGWLTRFKAEIEVIHAFWVEKHGEEFEEFAVWFAKLNPKGNPVASFISGKIFDMEAKVLDSILGSLRKRGLLGPNGDDYTMEFDGCMVPRDARIDDGLMRAIGAEVKEALEIDMKIVIKPMEPSGLPDNLPDVKPVDAWLEYLDASMWDEFIRFGVGMPVIANKSQPMTRKRAGYFNNQTFEVGAVVNGMVALIKPDMTVINLPEDAVRRDFRPGYCVTTHKAQGVTIADKYAVHEIERMDCHGAYVAITRGEDPRGITVIMPQHRE